MHKILAITFNTILVSLLFFIETSPSYAQELAQILNIQDFNEFRWQGNGDLKSDSNLCVFSDTGRYSINIQGSNGGFVLKDDLASIPFSIKWNDITSSNNSTSVSHNITLTNQTNATTNPDFCLSGNNANLSIIFNESDLQNARAGNYTGYLTILVEAQY